jgi:hypothetical protein
MRTWGWARANCPSTWGSTLSPTRRCVDSPPTELVAELLGQSAQRACKGPLVVCDDGRDQKDHKRDSARSFLRRHHHQQRLTTV